MSSSSPRPQILPRMGGQTRRLERLRSRGNVNAAAAALPPKKPRSSGQPSALAPPAPTPTAEPRRGEATRAAGNSEVPGLLRSGGPNAGNAKTGGAVKRKGSDGHSSPNPESTYAMLQQDDYDKADYSSDEVLSKSFAEKKVLSKRRDSPVKMVATDVVVLPVEHSRDNDAIIVETEAPSKSLPSIPLVQDEEAVQLTRTSVKDQVKEFMEGNRGDSPVKMAATDVEELPVEHLRDNEAIIVDSEAPFKSLPSIPLVQDEEAVQLTRTCVKEQVKEFMEVDRGDSVVNMATADLEDPPVENLRDNEVITVDTEVPSKPLPSNPLVQDEEAVQLARTFVNEQVKEFMEDASEPGVLQSLLSKITSLLVQATSLAAVLHDKIPPHVDAQTAAFATQVLELQQQVEEMSKKLSSTKEELEVTKAILKATQAAMLEAQSDQTTAITTMNSVAMRVGALFARLGIILDPPPNVVDSLEESIKQMTALVSLLGPVTRCLGLSLAKSSLTFGVAALLCREKGIKGMLEPPDMDTHQFVRSQGPEFHSLISQIVDSVEERLANSLEGGGWRGSRATKDP
uniref:Uncharacterized protein n=1 Tax=Leersia perrieri TaxID=77586 RepID=A0A0D9WFQ4_9ORYZ